MKAARAPPDQENRHEIDDTEDEDRKAQPPVAADMSVRTRLPLCTVHVRPFLSLR